MTQVGQPTHGRTSTDPVPDGHPRSADETGCTDETIRAQVAGSDRVPGRRQPSTHPLVEATLALSTTPLLVLSATGPDAGRILLANPPAGALTGHRDLPGRRFVDLLVQDGSVDADPLASGGAAGLADRPERPARLVCGDDHLDVLLLAVPVRDADERIEHVLVRLTLSGPGRVGMLRAVPAPRTRARTALTAPQESSQQSALRFTPTPAPRQVPTRAGQTLHPARSRALSPISPAAPPGPFRSADEDDRS